MHHASLLLLITKFSQQVFRPHRPRLPHRVLSIRSRDVPELQRGLDRAAVEREEERQERPDLPQRRPERRGARRCVVAVVEHHLRQRHRRRPHRNMGPQRIAPRPSRLHVRSPSKTKPYKQIYVIFSSSKNNLPRSLYTRSYILTPNSASSLHHSMVFWNKKLGTATGRRTRTHSTRTTTPTTRASSCPLRRASSSAPTPRW